MRAYHQVNFKYEIGKLYETKIKVTDKDYSLFPDVKVAEIFDCNKWKVIDMGYQFYGEGFHSYLTIERLKETWQTLDDFSRDYSYAGSEKVIIKCIIPKGSAYYKDNTGLIISNKLFIENKLSFEEVKEIYLKK